MELHEEFNRFRQKKAEDNAETLISEFEKQMDDCDITETRLWAVHLYAELLERGGDPGFVEYSVPIENIAARSEVEAISQSVESLKSTVFWLFIGLALLFLSR